MKRQKRVHVRMTDGGEIAFAPPASFTVTEGGVLLVTVSQEGDAWAIAPGAWQRVSETTDSGAVL